MSQWSYNDRRLFEEACINTALDETYSTTGWDYIDSEVSSTPLLSWSQHLEYFEQRLSFYLADIFGNP